MAIKRMDNVAIVLEDLEAAVAFFTELGMEKQDGAEIEGAWAASVVGLPDLRSEIVMMGTADGGTRLELTKYYRPEALASARPSPPPNTLGLHRVMFAVDDLEGTLDRLRPLGAELIGEVARYEDFYLLCYIRGPEGIIIGLAEQIG